MPYQKVDISQFTGEDDFMNFIHADQMKPKVKERKCLHFSIVFYNVLINLSLYFYIVSSNDS